DLLFLLLARRLPHSTLFPYTTLFRSYLLGVESDPGDRDGKPHTIRIDVSRRGATVRTRWQLLNVPSDLNRPKSARDLVNASLTADRKSTRLNSSHLGISYAVFCLKKK